MKILYIIYGLSSGGAERFITDLLNQLAVKEDLDITLLLIKTTGIPGNMFYAKELDSRVKIKSLGMDKITPSVFFKLNKAILQEKPDVVHVHLSPIILFCIVPLLFYRKPIYIETLHNEVSRIDNSSKIKRFLKSFVYKFGLAKVCTISDKNAREYQRVYGRDCDALIYNGRKKLQKTEAFLQVEDEIRGYKHDDNTLVFVHIARCAPQKNQKLLIEAFNDFSKDKNVSLIIIGSQFDSKEGVELQKQANDKIHFLGEKHNVQDYLFGSDAFVLSSIYEGMPITLIEALACGCVPLSTPVSGVVDIVKNGENGFVCKDFSKAAFIAMLNDYVEHRACIDRAGLMKLFDEKLSIDACANSYLKFYKKCLNSKKKR